MRIALSAAGLLLAANVPYLVLMVRYRHQLPQKWPSGILIILRYRLLSGLCFVTQVLFLPFGILNYIFRHHVKPLQFMQFVTKCLFYWAVLCLINLITFIVFFGHKTAYFLHINDWPIWVYRLRRWWRLNKDSILTVIRHRTLLLLFFLVIVFLINMLP